MRRSPLLLLIIVCISFASCQSGLSPILFNNRMVSINDSVKALGNLWGTKFGEIATSNGNYQDLIPIRKGIENYLDKSAEELEKMKDVKSSENYRKSVIDMIHYEKQLVENAFVPFEKLTGTSSMEDVKAAVDNLKKEAANEEEYVNNVKKAQAAYAAANGFGIKAKDDK